jgi:hypothetical protein
MGGVVRGAGLIALVLVFLAPSPGCRGSSERPCLERAECFAGEACVDGYCEEYDSKSVNRPKPQPDVRLPRPDTGEYSLSDWGGIDNFPIPPIEGFDGGVPDLGGARVRDQGR